MRVFILGFLKVSILLLVILVVTACGSDSTNGDEEKNDNATTENTSEETAAESITLKLGTFDPPEHVQTLAMQAFADDVKEATEGRVEIQVYSGGALGGPPSVYDNVLTGIMDIGYGLHGYSPGMWDISSVMHLPFLADAPAEKLSEIAYSLYEKYPEIQKEYEKFEPLWIFAVDPYHIVTNDKPVRTFEDVKGLKLRTPSREGNDMIESWGATPVSMPSPDIYDAMQKGVIDGSVLPFSAIADFTLYDTIKYITLGNFNTSMFYVIANKDSWAKISPEDQAAIKDLAGLRMSKIAGKAFDERAKEAREVAIKKGIEIIELEDAELNAFKQASEKVTEQWIKRMEEKGVNASEIVADIKKMLEE